MEKQSIMQTEKNNDVNNLKWLLGVAIAAICVTVVMIIAVFQIYLKRFQSDGSAENYSGYYAMIVEDRKSDFWQAIYKSAYEAGLEQDIYVDLFGENLSQNYSRQELMEIAIFSEVDGIIVEADESPEMAKLINRAASAGIPVVTLYSDSASSARCSYVGAGNYDVGREYGRQVLQIGESRRKSQDVLVLMDANSGDSSQNIVWSGIQETILRENQNDAIEYSFSMLAIDDSTTFSVEESIRKIFLEEDVPDIIICLNELNTTCVYQTVVDYNKVGEVRILGNYTSDIILRGIYRNVIDATVTVDTAQMGQYCVDALVEYEEFGNTSDYFAADITLIDANNISVYMGGDANEE